MVLLCIDLNRVLSGSANGKNLGHFGIKQKNIITKFLSRPKPEGLAVTIRLAFQGNGQGDEF